MNLKTEAGKNSFYQWDTNQQLIVENAPDCQEVHFSHRGDPAALVCSIYEADGERVVDVPNILLQQDKPITAYLFSRADDSNQTCYAWSFLVIGRPQPEDYVYTETEVLTYKALEERIIALEKGGGTVTDEQIATAVESYLEENPVEVPNVDLTGVVKSINGTTPDENGNVEIAVSGGGLTTTATALLLTILKDCYTGSNQDANILALENELLNNSGGSGGGEPEEPDVPDVPVEPETPTLTKISAVVNQDSAAVGTAASDLDITVTAHYSDGTTAEVTDYSISGTVASGENTFTIVYGGKTTTVKVTGENTPIYALYDTTVADYTGVSVNPLPEDVSMTILIDANVTAEPGSNERFFYMRDVSNKVLWQVGVIGTGLSYLMANGVSSGSVWGKALGGADTGDNMKISVTRRAGSTTCEAYWYQRTADGDEYCQKKSWDVGEFVATKDFTMMSGKSHYNSFEIYTNRYFTEAEALAFAGCAAFTEV